ncbi:hypothetical protein FC86_GL001181 [Holzapfeliella floricola DSM 23037 = JCM 16512]|uniref:Surface layer protein A domain-containing protein n=1 Tax=Holzapfeliella floricola DSM 23037 = JCM 16512 TaxID=1423744 RepID=A0A0R2DL46_9LACO|nr:hypothetical protein FC86_GL001181 [Holzapfeliella floricola DSM 23037 = JCM 16512]
MGQTASAATKQVIKEDDYNKGVTATVNYVKGYGISTWKNVDETPTRHYLPTGTQWIVNHVSMLTDNSFWYLVGNNEWASAKYYDLNHEYNNQKMNAVITIKNTNTFRKGVPIFSDTTSYNQTGFVKFNNDYQVFSRQLVNGKNWYNVGQNQWIEGQYADIKSEVSREDKVYPDNLPDVNQKNYNFYQNKIKNRQL